jgi:hypothetical protein
MFVVISKHQQSRGNANNLLKIKDAGISTTIYSKNLILCGAILGGKPIVGNRSSKQRSCSWSFDPVPFVHSISFHLMIIVRAFEWLKFHLSRPPVERVWIWWGRLWLSIASLGSGNRPWKQCADYGGNRRCYQWGDRHHRIPGLARRKYRTYRLSQLGRAANPQEWWDVVAIRQSVVTTIWTAKGVGTLQRVQHGNSS